MCYVDVNDVVQKPYVNKAIFAFVLYLYTDDPPIFDHFFLSLTTLFGPFFFNKKSENAIFFFAFFRFFLFFEIEKFLFFRNFSKICRKIFEIFQKSRFFSNCFYFEKSKKIQRMQKTCIFRFLLQNKETRLWSR